MTPAAGTRKQLRGALIEAAARVVATEGPAALTLRRVADEVGTSTMAIYTHFGGMSELRRALRAEGFTRLAAGLAGVAESSDPVADLVLVGRAYYENAIASPDLYRVTFMEQPLDADDAVAGSRAFASLVAAVERCIEAGRFDDADPGGLAREFWALGHGVIALRLAQLMSAEEALRCLEGAIFKLLCGFGDEPAAAERSLRRMRAAGRAGEAA